MLTLAQTTTPAAEFNPPCFDSQFSVRRPIGTESAEPARYCEITICEVLLRFSETARQNGMARGKA